MRKTKEERTSPLTVRFTDREREKLEELVDVLGSNLGTGVTRAQALNVAIREALEKRKEGSA